jgi:predicted  nucleic acid-binding Zn-ribbon protein
MKYLLIFAMLFATGALTHGADESDDGKVVSSKKLPSLKTLDSSIAAAKKKLESLGKQLEKLRKQIEVVQKAQGKLDSAKAGVDKAQSKMESTATRTTRADGTTYTQYDSAASKAYEDAQKVFNQAKRETRGVEEQLAALKDQETNLEKQEKAAADKLASLQDQRDEVEAAEAEKSAQAAPTEETGAAK